MASPRTLCFSGLSQADEAHLRELFATAAARAGGAWSLAPEAEAGVLVIDVDSIYGHMTWLRQHNSGREIVALTASEKAEADRVLRRPVTPDALAGLLRELDDGAPAAGPATDAREPSMADSDALDLAAFDDADAPAPVAAAPEPTVANEPEPAAAAPPHDPRLADYLEPGALTRPVRLQLGDAPPLVLDPAAGEYLAPSSLKPLAPYCRAVVTREMLQPLGDDELRALRTTTSAHPFVRLLWYFALINGEGRLADGLSADRRFRLSRWPQIEREFPKHFRIATAMMKQPATVDEIAAHSGAPAGEVADFVNAYLATGYAQAEPLATAAAEPDPIARGSLLGRLRGLRGG